MTTAVESSAATSGTGGGDGRPETADVFVVFGITGDLAKVMTFHSLYRLEQRGLLDVSDRRRGGQRLVGRAIFATAPANAIEGCGEQIDDEVFERLRGAAVVRER